MSAQPLPVAIIDVALPGFFAFELVEKLREQPHLANLKIILIPSVYRKTAYKRTPSSLYGADDYIEQHHLAEDLVPRIHSLLGGSPSVAGGHRAEEQASAAISADAEARSFAEATNTRIKNAEAQSVPSPEDEAVRQARRLARIIVSDIVLYHEARVNDGIRSGTFMSLFAEQIREGQNLFESRVPPQIRAKEDFLNDAFSAFIQQRQKELQLAAAAG